MEKATIEVRPVGGTVMFKLPYADTDLAWQDAAQFLELTKSSILAAMDMMGGRRLNALSPLLACEPCGQGRIMLRMPHKEIKVPWQDAVRFVNVIAEVIRTAKVDESEDRPAYDPQRLLAHGQLKLRH